MRMVTIDHIPDFIRYVHFLAENEMATTYGSTHVRVDMQEEDYKIHPFARDTTAVFIVYKDRSKG